ncbi:DUF6361 family protein [Halobacteriovorax sp. HLS]|uniref:DUF6361 family protein n=1 Tax=Halobacteriovorax sp. HLS TaxID=2234000 RepID=UPI000FDBC45E|nr:DUF6361 family protein [Halobacteriovorax sp. HLS]
MSVIPKSSVSWITLTPEDVQQAREVIRNLGGDSTVDSIGLGLPFEVISDIFFPGTSTLHTRIRYQIFVSGILYKMIIDSTSKSKKIKDPKYLLDKYELQLQDILLKNDPDGGVIGKKSRENLKYWPSIIYWGGINTLKFFNESGVSKEDLYKEILGQGNNTVINDDGEVEGDVKSVFNFDHQFANIVLNLFDDDTFKENTNFELTKEEALFYLSKFKNVSVGEDTLMNEWINSSYKKIRVYSDFNQIEPTGNKKVDTLLEQAKNYSKFSMGINHAYRWALCKEVARRYHDPELKDEWTQHQLNNQKYFENWLERNEELKQWSITQLKFAVKAYDIDDKVDGKLIDMFDTFKDLWNSGIDSQKFLESFEKTVREQEKHRRGNRSHFIDPTMSIPKLTQGQESDYLFDFRFSQGFRNARDILKALEKKGV